MKEKKRIPSPLDPRHSNPRKQDDESRSAPKPRRDTERLIDKLVERHKDTLDYLAK